MEPVKGRILALPANIRLDWKHFLGSNTLAYLYVIFICVHFVRCYWEKSCQCHNAITSTIMLWVKQARVFVLGKTTPVSLNAFVRSEHAWVEHVYGYILALPSNIRFGRKYLPGRCTLAYFCVISVDKESILLYYTMYDEIFRTLKEGELRCWCHKTFLFRIRIIG